MSETTECLFGRVRRSFERISVPVPRNRLVRLTLAGAVLSVAVALVLANAPMIYIGGMGGGPGEAQSAGFAADAAGSGATGNAGAAGADDAGVGEGAVAAATEGLSMGEVHIEESGALDLTVDGTFRPGNTVTVTVLDGDAPVEGAVVVVDDHYVGRTDDHGQIEVIVREDGAEITAETTELTGTLDVELEGVS